MLQTILGSTGNIIGEIYVTGKEENLHFDIE